MPRDRFTGLVPLSIERLDEGKTLDLLNEALEDAAADLVARPGVKGARKVILELEVTAMGHDPDTNAVTDLAVDAQARVKRPGRSSATTIAKVNPGGRVLVSPFVRDSRQRDISELVDETLRDE